MSVWLLSLMQLSLYRSFFYYVFIAISPIKKKKWNARLRRLGNLPKLESMSYGLNLFSVPFFLLAILLGCIWGYTKLDNFHWYDTKVIGSLSFYLYIVRAYIYELQTCCKGRKSCSGTLGHFS